MHSPSNKPHRKSRPRGRSFSISERAALGLAAVASVVLTLLVFGSALDHPFVYDDVELVVGNPLLETLNPLEHLTRDYWSKGGSILYYRPVVTFSLALDRTLFGTGPAGFHATNLLLHALVGFLVFLLVRDLSGTLAAATTALLFLLHPVQTEAVVWVAARTDLLAAFWVLVAAALYARLREPFSARRLPLLAAIAVALAAALLSKEAAITFPALFIGIDVCRLRRESVGWRAIGRRLAQRYVRLALPAIALIGAYLLLRTMALGQLLGAPGESDALWKNPLLYASTPVRLLTSVAVAALYIGLVVFPRRLSVDYFCDVVPLVTSAGSARFALALAVVIAAVAVCFWLARRSPLAAFGGLTALGTYALVSHLAFAAPIVMAERALYLPMVGITAIVAAGLLAIGERWPRIPYWVPLLILVIPLGLRSHQRVGDWSSESALFAATVRDAPRSSLAWNNLGAAQRTAGDLQAALVSFDRAASLCPGQFLARFNAARTLRMLGQLEPAETRLRELAIASPERQDEVWLDLGQLLLLRAATIESEGQAVLARQLREEAVEQARTFAPRAEQADLAATFELIVARGEWGLERPNPAEAAFRAALAAARSHAENTGGTAAALLLEASVLDEHAAFAVATRRPELAVQNWDRAALLSANAGATVPAARRLYQAARVLLAEGQRDAAVERLRRAEGLAAGDASLLRAIRSALQQLG